MSESIAGKSGNPFDVQVRDAQRLKGLSSLEEREAASIGHCDAQTGRLSHSGKPAQSK